MVHSPARSVKTLRRKISNGERGGSDRDRDALMRFSDRLRLLASEYSDHRHDKLLRQSAIISESVDIDLVDVLEDREATEAIVRWIHRTYENEETNSDYRSGLRTFAKRLDEADNADRETDHRGIPETVAWVPSDTSNSYDPAPDPADMLRHHEVSEMVDHTPNPRDKALIALQFDAGLRSGELEPLTVGDITDGQWGLQVSVDGRRGQRSVTLVPSVPYVKRWRYEAHPRSDERDAPLWCNLTSGESVSNRRYLDVFHAAGSRVGITKPTTPTNLRKSNASWLARRGASSHLIEDRQGRKRGSRAVARYVARFGPDAEGRRYASLHGADVEDADEPPDVRPPACPRCGEATPADEPTCVWCGQAMEPGAAEAAETVRSRLQEAMARSDDPGQRSALLSALQEVETNPDVASRLIEEAAALHD